MTTKSSISCHPKSSLYEQLLNLKAKNERKRDPLTFLLFLTEYTWSFRILRALAYSLVVQILAEVIGLSIQLIINFDLALFLKYGGHAGFQIFVLANVGNIILTGVDVTNFAVQYWNKLLPLELAGRKTYKKMMLECTLLKIVVFSDVLCAFVGGFMLSINHTYNYNAVFLIRLYRNLLPEYLAYIFITYYEGCSVLCTSMAVVGSFILSHVSFNTSFQIRVIKRFVERICETQCREGDQYYNKTSQECITQRLKICIMLHQLIHREIKVLTALIYQAIFLYSIGVLFFGGGVMIDVLGHEKSGSTNFHFIPIILGGLLTTGLYAFIGQMMKNEIFRALYSLSTIVSRTRSLEK